MLCRPPRSALACALLVPLVATSPGHAAGRAVAISPGDLDRVSEIASPCPTFSWAAVAGAAGYELVVLDIETAGEPQVVLRQTIAGAALSWTPGASRCLASAHSYGWTVAALDSAGQVVGGEDAWADLRRFTLPALPSDAELAAAFEVLRRWRSGRGEGGGNESPAPRKEGAAPPPADRTLAATVNAAVLGENVSLSGASHGVAGVSSSGGGAGVFARNVGGGPDLMLDGALDGNPDARLTEKFLDRPSAELQGFDFLNSGGGGMVLSVDGNSVSMVGHTHTGGEIVSGTVADVRIATTLTRDGEVMTIVRASDGSGSNLDADLLDGQHGAGFQARVTGVCPAGRAMRGIGADGTVDCADLGGAPELSVVDDPAHFVGVWPSIAVGVDGFPVISYHDSTAGSLKVAKCDDAACSGGDETVTTVDDPTNSVGWRNDLAIGSDGYPVIAYYVQTANDLKVVKCNDPACAPGGETFTVLESADVAGLFLAIAIGADGFPLVAFWNDSDQSVHVIKCDDLACAGGGEADNVVDTGTFVGFFVAIAVPPDGLPLLAYFDDLNNLLLVAKCNDAACAGGDEQISAVDGPGGQYTYISIATGADGLPVIGYFSETEGSLKVCKCNDVDCAGGDETVSKVDDGGSGSAGAGAAMTVGSDGLPVISYHSTADQSLRVARCNDPACRNRLITAVDDPADSVALYTAIALGSDGFPVVAYHDQTTGTLRVAKCNTHSCLSQ